MHRRCFGARLARGRRGRQKGGEKEPEDHALGYSRGGFGTKFHLLTDSNGIPLNAVVSAGQRHESKFFEQVMNGVKIKRAGGGRPRQRSALPQGRVSPAKRGGAVPRLVEGMSPDRDAIREARGQLLSDADAGNDQGDAQLRVTQRLEETSRKGAKLAKEDMTENEIATLVVDAALAVHRVLGPGLLESVYEAALAFELRERKLHVQRQVPIPIRYRDVIFDGGFERILSSKAS